jgi:ketosteroid isomerase-like protein
MFIKPFAIIIAWALSVATGVLLIPSAASSQLNPGPNWTAMVAPRVKEVLDAQVAAWNKGDLKGFMAGYWKSDKLSFFSGKDKSQGWQATLERYQKRYQAEGREMGTLSFSELEIEAFNGESAWVRGRWKVVTSKETLDGLFTLIFKKFPEGWRIVHDHTSG